MARLEIFFLQMFPNFYATACFEIEDEMALSWFEPTSVELHQTGTFQTLYWLNYSAAAL